MYNQKNHEKVHESTFKLKSAELVSFWRDCEMILSWSSILGKFDDGLGTLEMHTSIYRLSDIDGQWTPQTHLLQIPRNSFAAIVVPEALLPCS